MLNKVLSNYIFKTFDPWVWNWEPEEPTGSEAQRIRESNLSPSIETLLVISSETHAE